jgi:hypothetical protein
MIRGIGRPVRNTVLDYMYVNAWTNLAPNAKYVSFSHDVVDREVMRFWLFSMKRSNRDPNFICNAHV